jgi:hypothetical protein
MSMIRMKQISQLELSAIRLLFPISLPALPIITGQNPKTQRAMKLLPQMIHLAPPAAKAQRKTMAVQTIYLQAVAALHPPRPPFSRSGLRKIRPQFTSSLVRSAQDTYTVSYGPYNGADTYNVTFNDSDKSGAIPYTINYLNSGTPYYFKVRANNGCMPGEWSNTLSLRTTAAGSTSKAYSYKATSGGALGTSCSEYKVLPGDSFWALAQNTSSFGMLIKPDLQALIHLLLSEPAGHCR